MGEELKKIIDGENSTEQPFLFCLNGHKVPVRKWNDMGVLNKRYCSICDKLYDLSELSEKVLGYARDCLD